MSNSAKAPTRLGKAPEGKPKMLPDSAMPNIPGPSGNLGGGLGMGAKVKGGLDGGLKGAMSHLDHHAKGKFHKSRMGG